MAQPVVKATERKPDSSPTIPELFKGKCVLVTGATGFLGKVLVEKLLRSCSGIKEICILVRQSEKDTSSRIDKYIAHSVFNRLREEQPDALNKIRPLTGNVEEDNLGLCDLNIQKVTSDVQFVFHCAANVRFDDKARSILNTNLVGVQNVLSLCKRCRNLKALVHVSTAYAFCNRTLITEKVYAESLNPTDLIETSRWMPEDQLHYVCKQFLGNRPAIYHFSKAMAEVLIMESQLDFPAIIVRPSIITASVAEPYPGWIDNINGPSGFILTCGRGVVRTLLIEPDVHADWVPVDIVANTLIAAAHYMAVKSEYKSPNRTLKEVNKVPVINCTCPEENLVTWMKFVNYCLPCLKKYPPTDVIDKPGGTVTRYRIIYTICRLFSHYLPAIIIDAALYVVQQKPKFVRLYNRIHRVMGHLEYYTTQSFTFRSTNKQKLLDLMSPEDREVFSINQRELKWDQYVENYVHGVRSYYLKQDDQTLPCAKTRMMWFHCFWMLIKVPCWFGIYWLIIKPFHKAVFSKNPLLFSSVLPSNPFKLKMSGTTWWHL